MNELDQSKKKKKRFECAEVVKSYRVSILHIVLISNVWWDKWKTESVKTRRKENDSGWNQYREVKMLVLVLVAVNLSVIFLSF